MTQILDGKELITDGYARLEFLDVVNRARERSKRTESLRTLCVANLASHYIQHPAADPSKTPLPKIALQSGCSGIVDSLVDRLNDCLLLYDIPRQTCPAHGLSELFIREFNRDYPMQLEVLSDCVLRLRIESKLAAEKLEGLQKLAFSLCNDASIALFLDSEVLEAVDGRFCKFFSLFLGPYVASFYYTDSKQIHNETIQNYLRELLSSCSKLELVDLSSTPHLRGDNLQAISLASRNTLLKLNLAGCAHLEDQQALMIAINLPQLRELSVAGCVKLTDESFYAFIMECPFVTKLNFSKTSVCEFAGKRYLRHSSIRELIIADTEVRDSVLQVIHEYMPTLDHLDLSRCQRIGVKALGAFISRRLTLYLVLEGCLQFDQTAKDVLLKQNPFGLARFEKDDSIQDIALVVPTKQELTLVHFSAYLSVAFSCSQAIAFYHEVEKMLYIRLTPFTHELQGLVNKKIRDFYNLEVLLARYDVHLEVSYEVLTQSESFHALTKFVRRMCPFVCKLEIDHLGNPERDIECAKITTKWSFPNLTSLSFTVASLKGSEIAYIEAPKLLELSLDGCARTMLSTFESLPKQFSKLQKLSVTNCAFFGYADLANLVRCYPDSTTIVYTKPLLAIENSALSFQQQLALLRYFYRMHDDESIAKLELSLSITAATLVECFKVATSLSLSRLLFRCHDMLSQLFDGGLAVRESEGRLLLVISNYKSIVCQTQSATCQFFDSLQQQTDLEIELIITDFDELALQAFALHLRESCQKVKRIRFDGCAVLSGADVVILAGLFSELRHFHFSNLPHFTLSDFEAIFAIYSHILSIELCSLPKVTYQVVSLISQRCRELVWLSLRSMKLNEVTFDPTYFDLPKLTNLYLADTDCTDRSIELLVKKNRKINVLDLSRTKITAQALGRFIDLPLLRIIRLDDCLAIDDDALSKLTHKANLFEEIYLNGCVQVSESGLWSLLQHCKSLKILEINRGRIDPLVVEHASRPNGTSVNLALDLVLPLNRLSAQIIFYRHQTIRSLCLTNCSEDTLEHVLKSAPKISSLALKCAKQEKQASDTTLEIIPKYCLDLTSLELELFPYITIAGVEAIVKKLPQLTTLSIRNCANISSIQVRELGAKYSTLTIIDNS